MEETVRLVSEALERKRRLEFDNEPFSRLVRRFQDMAFGYAYSIAGDPLAAQDIVQESFLLAWRRLEQLEKPEAFPGWFRRVVRRCALDEVARQRPVLLDSVLEANLPDRGSTPVDLVLEREAMQEVRDAIARLPERLRASVVLHYVDGYRLADVAEFLEIDSVTARKRVQRGRERMQKDLENRIRMSVQELRPGRDSRLLDNVNIYTNFAIAAQLGQISLLEAMLVDGIDVNEPDAMGRTLLHWAVENGHRDAVALLLKNGADQHLRDREGRSARHIAQSSADGHTLLEILNEYR